MSGKEYLRWRAYESEWQPILRYQVCFVSPLGIEIRETSLKNSMTSSAENSTLSTVSGGPEGFVKVVDHFLSQRECAFVLAELNYAHWRPSHLIGRHETGRETAFLSARRVSETANQDWFPDELNGFLSEIVRRLTDWLPMDSDCLEYWQATKYSRGGHLDHHMDAGYWASHPWGERTRTFLIYLTTPVQGGSTYFRALDYYVPAVSGRLVWWENLFADGRPNHRALHSGTRVDAGDKVTLVTWLREKSVRV